MKRILLTAIVTILACTAPTPAQEPDAQILGRGDSASSVKWAGFLPGEQSGEPETIVYAVPTLPNSFVGVWSPRTGEIVRKISASTTDRIFQFFIGPRGYAVAQDKLATLWNTKTWENLGPLGQNSISPAGCWFDPHSDSAIVATPVNGFRLWNLRTRTVLHEYSFDTVKFPNAAAFSRSGERAAVVAGAVNSPQHFFFLNMANEKVLWEKVPEYPYYHPTIYTDGTGEMRIAVAGLVEIGNTGVLEYDEAGQEVMRYLVKGGSVASLDYRLDGRYLLAALTGGSDAVVWDTETGGEVLRLHHRGTISGAGFDPSGGYALTNGDSGVVLWKLPEFGQSGVHSDNMVDGGTVRLRSTYPNPAQDRVQVLAELGRRSHIRLALVDESGREVCVVAENGYEAGSHLFSFNAAQLPPGSYFCELRSSYGRDVVPITILR